MNSNTGFLLKLLVLLFVLMVAYWCREVVAGQAPLEHSLTGLVMACCSLLLNLMMLSMRRIHRNAMGQYDVQLQREIDRIRDMYAMSSRSVFCVLNISGEPSAEDVMTHVAELYEARCGTREAKQVLLIQWPDGNRTQATMQEIAQRKQEFDCLTVIMGDKEHVG